MKTPKFLRTQQNRVVFFFIVLGLIGTIAGAIRNFLVLLGAIPIALYWLYLIGKSDSNGDIK